MEIEHRIIVNVALVFIAAYGVCGCKSGRDLAYDGTFRYVCTSQVGPIACGATNVIDVINTLFREGNESLSSNGCPYGISLIYHTETEDDRAATDSLTLPSCPIHDACMMVAHHYNLSYFYQKGVINFSDMSEVDRTCRRCARCEYGLCDSAEIGPFHFDCKSMDHIVREVCVSSNRQLRESGHSGFFLAQLVFEGPIAGGHTIHIERGCVRSVLIQVAQSMGLKLACDVECFYLYKKKLEIQSLERSLLLIPDGGPGQGQ